MIAIKLYSLLIVTTSVLHKEQEATHTYDPVTYWLQYGINIAWIFGSWLVLTRVTIRFIEPPKSPLQKLLTTNNNNNNEIFLFAEQTFCSLSSGFGENTRLCHHWSDKNLYNIRYVESFLLGLAKMVNFVAVLDVSERFCHSRHHNSATIHISVIVKIPTTIASNEDRSRCWHPCAQGRS